MAHEATELLGKFVLAAVVGVAIAALFKFVASQNKIWREQFKRRQEVIKSNGFHAASGKPMPRRPAIVALFGMFGICTSIAWLGFTLFANSLLASGDGSTVAQHASPFVTVGSWCAYFVSGIVAATSTTKMMRVRSCIAAHLFPWFILSEVHHLDDLLFLSLVILASFALFGGLWIYLLSDGRTG